MKPCLIIHPEDNVAVALRDLPAGAEVPVVSETIRLIDPIPAGHKFARTFILSGQEVVKYGSCIGRACQDILPGQWVHTHNLKTSLDGVLSYTYHPDYSPLPSSEEAFFMGYPRPDGRAGIRNELWIIPTVGCVNDVARAIADRCRHLVFGSVENVAAFSHPYGCSQMGEDQENTRRILADLIRHPNAGGVLVLGLGCENSNIDVMKSYIGDYDPRRIMFLSAQDTEDEIEEGIWLMEKLARNAACDRRVPVSCSRLVVGLKCGGSDGLSGITANPTVGIFSDLLISRGGTAILTEVPEMFGAETLLMNRCRDEALFSRTVELINDFKNYFTRHGQTIYENPSPGNKQGGISTL